MRKLLTFLTLLTLFFTTGWAAEQTITLTATTFGSPTSYQTKSANVSGYRFTVNQMMTSTNPRGAIQMNSTKGDGTLYNTTAIPGLKSIKVNVASGNRTYTVTTGTSQNPTANSQTGTTGGTYDAQTGNTYFQLKVSGASYFSSIEITYDPDAGSSTSTTYSLTLPTVTGGSVSATGYSDLTAIPSGTNMTVTATPSTGYTLDWMKANGTEVQNPYTFAIAENTTITASFVQEQASTTEWVLTSPSNLTTGDIVLIVDKYSSRAMSNDKGTGAAPSATSVTLNSNKDKVTAGVTAALQWNVTNNNGTFQFTVPSSGNYLYTNNSNDGVRVGSTQNAITNHDFTINSNFLYNTATSRYLGVYNNKDWRCYTSSSVNISNTQVAFYKKVETGSHSVNVGTITGEGTITPSSGSANTGDVITVTAEPATGYQLTALAYNGTAIDITSTPYTFTMPDADVTLTATFTAINYNIYRTITAQNTNDQGGWIGSWNENCTLPDGAQGTDYTVTSTYGKEVQFKAGNNEGYKILAENVTAKDANNNNVPLTVVSSDNSGIVFKFNMPASNVTISAYFTFYQPTLRLAGRFNGRPSSDWITDSSGPEFDYDGNEYTIDAYFTGAENDNGANVDYFYLRSDNSDLKASASGNCWVAENGGTYNLGGSSNFRIYPGVYTLTVNKARTQVVITKKNPTFTFTPASGSIVYVGQTVSATSDLATMIANITDSGKAGTVGDVTCSPSTLETTGNNQSVTASQSIGNYTATATATYTVNEILQDDVYTLVTSTSDLNTTDDYIIVSKDYNMAMAGQNNNNRAATEITLTNEGTQAVANEETQVFNLEQGSDGWYFNTGNGYLYAASSSANQLKTHTSQENAEAEISINSTTGEASVEFISDNRNVMQYNNGSTLFACYATASQSPVYLYKKAGSALPKAATPTFSPAAGTYTEAQSVTITCATDGATIYWNYGNTTPTTSSTLYEEPITVSSNTTITAIAVAEGYRNSDKATATYTINLPQVETPTFSPAAGTYAEAQSVTIACATTGASIYYTTDGTNPTTSSSVYTSAITVSETTTIKAIAVKDGMNNSEVASATYTISSGGTTGDYVKVTTAADLTDGEYLIVYEDGLVAFDGSLETLDKVSNTVDIVIASDGKIVSNETVDAAIFTIDVAAGTIKSASGKYIGASSNANTITTSTDPLTNNISIDEDENAVIKGEGGAYLRYNYASNQLRFRYYKSASYTDQQPVALYKKVETTVAAPTFSPEGGTYNLDVTVSIKCSTNGATIHYTTDGTDPDTNSPTYSGTFVVSTTTTVKAIAVKGGKESTISSATYTIDKNAQTSTVNFEYTEPLIGDIGYFTVSDESGFTPVWTLDGQYGVLGTAYDGTNNHIATSWLLSPIVNMTGAVAPVLKFDHQINNSFNDVDEQCTLWIREYNNGTPGQWTQMNISFSTPDPTRGWTDDHATFDMSDYNDKQIQIGFKYMNDSETDGAGKWEIQNFSIAENSDIIFVNNIAEFLDNEKVADSKVAHFKNPVVVLYHYQQYLDETTGDYQNDYIWVKDESGYAIIYGHYLTVEYENGDVIPAGFTATKNYYTVGQFYQMYEPEGLQPSTQKVLADPEPVTLQSLKDNKNSYNGHYVTISKMQIQFNQGELVAYTSSSSGQRRFSVGDATLAIADNQAGTTTSANSGKIIGYNNFDNPWLETLDYPSYENTTNVYGYYNIKGIFEQYNGTWEFMPIIITPWEEQKVTLHDLCLLDVKSEGDNDYIISNNVQVVYVKDNSIWVKDDDGQSIWETEPEDGDNNYQIEIEGNTRPNQAYYDQSNWCEMELANNVTAPAVGTIIKGGSISGTYADKLNPKMTGVTLTGDYVYSTGVSYAPNYYVPANFYSSQHQSCTGPQEHGTFFFMNPKPQEFARIAWAIADGNGNLVLPGQGATAKYTDDQGVEHTIELNGHGFTGAFKVNMGLNADQTVTLQQGKGYSNFDAIIRLETTGGSGAPMLKAAKPDGANYVVYPLNITGETLTGIDAITVNDASREVVATEYYNVAGQRSERPVEGVNIIVTRYSDGSTSTAKVLK